MRGVALLTLFAFGCATLRQPVNVVPEPPPRVVVAEPELELWIEGSGSVDPGESSEVATKAEGALHSALAGRGVVGGEVDGVLRVRERAVARTGGRKLVQGLAIAGIVVVIAAVVVVLVYGAVHGRGGSSSGGGKGTHLARSAPAPGGAPAAGSGRVHGSVAAPPREAGVRAARAPSRGEGGVIDMEGGEPSSFPTPDDSPEPPPAAAEAAAPEQDLVAERGFFDGDAVELSLVLEDAHTGAVLWTRTLRDDSDPRDVEAIARLIEKALSGQDWARRAGGASGR